MRNKKSNQHPYIYEKILMYKCQLLIKYVRRYLVTIPKFLSNTTTIFEIVIIRTMESNQSF